MSSFKQAAAGVSAVAAAFVLAACHQQNVAPLPDGDSEEALGHEGAVMNHHPANQEPATVEPQMQNPPGAEPDNTVGPEGRYEPTPDRGPANSTSD